jgi:putative membrane protein
MLQLLTRWAINAGALLALPFFFSSIQITGIPAALVAALVLGLLNALIRPILLLLTLPVTVLTLGLFIFVINALLFWLAAYALDGFRVDGFWAAFWGAIVYSLISWAGNALIFGGKK